MIPRAVSQPRWRRSDAARVSERVVGSRPVSAKIVLNAQDRVRLQSVGHSGRFRPFRREQLEQPITSLFEQQVALHPERVAVKTRNESMTYRALDAAATRLARAITRHARPTGGVESVAFLFGQTSAAVTATLAALKARRPYVPLEPSHPQERLVEILNDARATLLVTDSRHLPLVNALSDKWPVLNVDELDAFVVPEAPMVLHPATDLAAIFYTSGTTGKPKGVMQDHRGILHRVMIDADGYGIHPGDRLSLLSPPTYSVSLRNLFGAVLSGATVCPFDFEVEGLGRLARWLIEERITIFSATPTVFRHFAATLTGEEDFGDVRLVDVGGEGARKTDVELYKRHFSPACILANTLGCNEAGVYRRYFIDRNTVIDGDIVPVGYGVADKEVVLLSHGKEVAPNELGEIAIRSRYLPSGYWGRPDLTDAVFVPDPDGGGQRLYLTGDMGEMRPDGCLIYRGRKDSRAKIRGQFVDLAELENSLLQHDGVTEAVVKAVERYGNRTQLVAFVVASPEAALTTRKLRRFLARTIPAFMVPSKFEFLSALPKLTNGKVDRQALVLPDETRGAVRQIERADGPPYVAPIETIEHQLVEIWEELLRVHPIGVRDNFFDLGGDSLMALQMIEEVELRCGEPVPAAALIGGATLGELAKMLVEQRLHERTALVVKVQSGDSSWPFFFLHGDFRGGGFYCVNLARALGEHQRFYVVAAHGLNGDAVPPTIEAMAAAYVEMIQAAEPQGPYLLGGLCHAGLIAFEIARQLERKGHKVGLVAMIGPPAWNPPHWRWIKDTVAAIVGVCGGHHDRATDLFLAMRTQRVRLRQFAEYSVTWLKETARMSLHERIATATRLTNRLVSGVLVSEKPWVADPLQPPPTDDDVMLTYRRAVASYVRRSYSGRVALFWPDEVPINTLGRSPLQWESAPDPSLGWRTVVADLEIHQLPGDYTTSITRHAHILANRLKTSVKRARAQQGNAAAPHRDADAGLLSRLFLPSRVR